MAEINLKIEGMSCHHCVMRVEKAISGLPAIIQSDVAIGSAKVTFDEAKLNEKEVREAVEKAGYKVVS
jgi:copper chaperone